MKAAARKSELTFQSNARRGIQTGPLAKRGLLVPELRRLFVVVLPDGKAPKVVLICAID
jgi:hypothetical protein